MPEGIDAPPQKGPDALVRALLPLVAVVATVPPALVAPAVAPMSSPEVLLVGGAAVLVGVGLTAAGTWRLLDAGARAVPAGGLLGAAVLLGEGVAIGGDLAPAGSPGPVVGAAGGALAGAVLLGVLVRWRYRARPGAPAPRSVRLPLVGAAVLLVVLATTRGSVPAWLVALGVVGALLAGLPLVVRHVRAGTPRAALAADPAPRPTENAENAENAETAADAADAPASRPDDPHWTVEPATTPVPTPGRAVPWGPTLRVLHLAGADPDTAATLHRSLAAAGHEVTVLSPRSPGALDRIEHHGSGTVRWAHPVRRGWTRTGRSLAYVASAVVAARRTRADLVVEELGPTPGPLAVPRWTTRPVVALATCLPDPEPTDRWAPLLRLRWWAVRAHHSVVVRSPGAADALAAGRSRADVALVGDGTTAGLAGAHDRDDLDVLGGQLADVYLAAVTRGAMARSGAVDRLLAGRPRV